MRTRRTRTAPRVAQLARLTNAARIAVDTLWAHKLRSSLTILGIVIGIAGVVLVGAAIEALREYAVTTTAQAFGANTFLISQVSSFGSLSRKELADKLRRNPEIYRREAEAIGRSLENTLHTASTLRRNADVRFRNLTFLAADITGAAAPILEIRDIRLERGRFFTEEENRRSQRLAVIGMDVVDELFPGIDPIGKEIKLAGVPFQVIGIQERQGSTFGASQDRYVWIPLLAFEKIWGSRLSMTIFAQPREGVEFEEAQEETRMQIRRRRGLLPDEPDDFDILIPEAGRSFLSRLTGMIAVAIVPISSVALLVAGIVVMNMMLVSVTERTHEIGIRKSLGARRSDILIQILFESTLLCAVGGEAGLMVSYLGTLGLSRAFSVPVGVPVSYAVLALAVAGGIGTIAGIYPAYLAARLDPVVALRAEG